MSKLKAAILLSIIAAVSVFSTLLFCNNICYSEYSRAKKCLEQAGYSMNDLGMYIFEYSYDVKYSESDCHFSGREEYYLDGYRFKLFSDFIKK